VLHDHDAARSRRGLRNSILALAVFARFLPPPLRRAAAALWLAGAAIAGMTAVLAATHRKASSPGMFAAVAVVLVVLAIATARGALWALVVSSVLLGAQVFGALGSGWELMRGADGDKAEALRSLGIDPTFGIALNLVYSLVAFALFMWALGRARRQAPSTAPSDSPGSGAVPT
jgi:hypothetical protein